MPRCANWTSSNDLRSRADRGPCGHLQARPVLPRHQNFGDRTPLRPSRQRHWSSQHQYELSNTRETAGAVRYDPVTHSLLPYLRSGRSLTEAIDLPLHHVAAVKLHKLTHTALAVLQARPASWLPCISLAGSAQRNKSNATESLTARRRKSTPSKTKATGKTNKPTEQYDSNGPDLTNPLIDAYLADPAAKAKKVARPQLRTGEKTITNPLFDNKRFVPGWEPSLPREKEEAILKKLEDEEAAAKAIEDKKLTSFNLDPNVRTRRKLERRLVINGVKRKGRLTKADIIARTERQSVFKSQALPTSTKKMQKVTNQLAGKTVSEALVQLRFSKKRIARDVIKGLEIAQNEAIVTRGMGLGGGKLAQKRWEAQRSQTQLSSGEIRSAVASQKLSTAKEKPGRPVNIELKDGSRKIVRDPSEIYIDQIWVGKGEMWKSPEYRARGMVNMLRHRTTSELIHFNNCVW